MNQNQLQVLAEARKGAQPLTENTFSSYFSQGGLKSDVDPETKLVNVWVFDKRDFKRMTKVHQDIVKGMPEFADIEPKKVSDTHYTFDYNPKYPESKPDKKVAKPYKKAPFVMEDVLKENLDATNEAADFLKSLEG